MGCDAEGGAGRGVVDAILAVAARARRPRHRAGRAQHPRRRRARHYCRSARADPGAAARGWQTGADAEELGMSVRTVETHRQNIATNAQPGRRRNHQVRRRALQRSGCVGSRAERLRRGTGFAVTVLALPKAPLEDRFPCRCLFAFARAVDWLTDRFGSIAKWAVIPVVLHQRGQRRGALRARHRSTHVLEVRVVRVRRLRDAGGAAQVLLPEQARARRRALPGRWQRQRRGC